MSQLSARRTIHIEFAARRNEEQPLRQIGQEMVA